VFSDNEKTPAATDPSFPLMSAGWQCWEWNITPDDSYHFYIGGAEVTEMGINAGKGDNNGGNFSPLPTVTELEIGWQYFGTGPFRDGSTRSPSARIALGAATNGAPVDRGRQRGPGHR
jgi:hypothetical protein